MNRDPRYYLQHKSQMALLRNKQLQNSIPKYILSIPKYAFIHPTKVAGSAFIKYVEKYYPQYFEYKGHEIKSSDVLKPIIFIRDPYDRFISMYKYWKYGSVDYNGHKHSITYLGNVKKYNIKDFIFFVKNKDRILISPFTSFTHIRPQSWWIEEKDYNNCIVLFYSKNDMESKIFQLFDYLESIKVLKNQKHPFSRINVSNQGNENMIKEKIILDNDDINEINNIYKSDFDLIEKIKNNQELFKKVF